MLYDAYKRITRYETVQCAMLWFGMVWYGIWRSTLLKRGTLRLFKLGFGSDR